jgi:hypothetical protein
VSNIIIRENKTSLQNLSANLSAHTNGHTLSKHCVCVAMFVANSFVEIIIFIIVLAEYLAYLYKPILLVFFYYSVYLKYLPASVYAS